MGLSKIICILFLVFGSTLFAFLPQEQGQILYFLQKGEAEKAFHLYLEKQKQQCHDFDLLKEMGLILLTQGAKNKDPEIQLLSLFGASLASNLNLLPVFASALSSKELSIQLAALAGLTDLQDDEADLLIRQALSSPFLLTRLEAAYSLAKKNDPLVLGHIQSLMTKVPDELKALFPQIVVKLTGNGSTQMLKQFLSDPNVEVKIEAIRYVAKEGRDDLLSSIRSSATSPHPGLQEAALFALGIFKDYSSFPLIQTIAQQKEGELKLAAAFALLSFEEQNALNIILEEAEKENLFAITLLGQIGSKSDQENQSKIIRCLEKITNSPNATLRFNSGAALLSLKHPSALKAVKEFLISSHKGSGITICHSPGRTLSAFRIVPSADQLVKKNPEILTQTQRIKDELLIDALELNEEDFLDLATEIFESKDSYLIPHVVELLCHHKTEKVIQFFTQMEQKAGAPLVRNYCLLALYRLDGEKMAEEKLIAFIEKQQKVALIQMKENDPKLKKPLSKYVLTPEESSQLLLLTFELFCQKQSEKGILALVKAMGEGHPKNKYPLAGLLIKGVE